MEGIQVERLKVFWGFSDEEERYNLDELCKEIGNLKGEGKDKLRDFIKEHASFDPKEREFIFIGNCDEAYKLLRPFMQEFMPYLSFDMVYSGMESGQDVWGRCKVDFDEDYDGGIPEILWHLVETDEYENASEWYGNWASDHEEETKDWLRDNKIDGSEYYSFDADGYVKFIEAFPKAQEEFFEYIEGL